MSGKGWRDEYFASTLRETARFVPAWEIFNVVSFSVSYGSLLNYAKERKLSRWIVARLEKEYERWFTSGGKEKGRTSSWGSGQKPGGKPCASKGSVSARKVLQVGDRIFPRRDGAAKKNKRGARRG